MERNRLLLLTPDFPPNQGGVARYLENVAHYFSDRIYVITSVLGAAQRESRYPILIYPLLFVWIWPKWMASVALLIQKRSLADIVMVSHVLPYGVAAWVASWFTKKPFVVFSHGLDIRLSKQSLIKKWLTRTVLSHARVVVANSQALAFEIARDFHVAMPIVVYPCVGERTNVSHKTQETDRVEILTVSRLIERKGHTQVLMALSQLKQTGTMPNFRYVIVGDGPMRKTLEDLVGQLHLDEVEFLGEVTDEMKNRCYAQADFFVMPVKADAIDKEGFGIVFQEAASYELPSISTKLEGVDEAILDGQTGILVEPGDLIALEGAIQKLATDADYRKALGQQAYTRASREFSCEMQLSKLEPFL